jgi:WhiB family redox-sensing transcriptional regulator
MPGYDEINWSKAACEGAPTNLFYIIEEDKRVINLVGYEPTRRICGTCPIWKECLNYAMANEGYGMWGGLISKERNALRKRDGSQLRENAIRELTKYGILREEIEAIANEHTDYERSVENEFTYYGEDDTAGNC